MTKDLAYYRMLPYEREWLPRDDESGRDFVACLKDIPEIYGTGETKQAALAVLWTAFDDQITWCLEEGVEIPEPSMARPSDHRTVEIVMEKIIAVPAGRVREAALTKAATRTGANTASYRTSKPLEFAELQQVA